ncbi:MAG: RES domain-containing protein [Paracoccaceae bacterium]|jgi:RES domain-containing protein
MASSSITYQFSKKVGEKPGAGEDFIFAYRLVAPRWAEIPLSGEGSRLYGGRWNSPGHSIVYLSTSRALAALELLVHLTTPDSRVIPRVLIKARIPRALICGELFQATGWRDNPPGIDSTDQGDDWLAHGRTAGVWAPSVIIPEEQNLLLNPNHPDFSKIEVVQTKPFHFDHRLSEPQSKLS